jgi:hypothetical protein
MLRSTHDSGGFPGRYGMVIGTRTVSDPAHCLPVEGPEGIRPAIHFEVPSKWVESGVIHLAPPSPAKP